MMLLGSSLSSCLTCIDFAEVQGVCRDSGSRGTGTGGSGSDPEFGVHCKAVRFSEEVLFSILMDISNDYYESTIIL